MIFCLNPFCFRSRFRQPKSQRNITGWRCLNPFCFRSRFRQTVLAAESPAEVLIPFASGHDSDYEAFRKGDAVIWS